MNAAKHEHIVGRYVVRTEWRGHTLLYEVASRQGVLVATGIDALSRNEEAAVKGIAERLFGKDEHETNTHGRPTKAMLD